MELYILLSDKCNFECSHCINLSGPKASRWLLNDADIDLLAKQINSNLNIEKIHFTGGEPTLHLDKIEKLQLKIKRDEINYNITTNGWFIKKGGIEFLKKIKLNNITISYDIYHEKFISKSELLTLAKQLDKHNLKLKIHLVYENAKDLLYLDEFKKLGFQTSWSRIISSGRNNTFNNKNYSANYLEELTQKRCPSLELDRIIYMPSLGYTYCCGPVIFDSSDDKYEYYSKEISELNNSKFNNEIKKHNFSKQIDIRNLTVNQIGKFKPETECDICSILHTRIANKLPHLYELLINDESRIIYKYEEFINERIINILINNFIPQYISELDINILGNIYIEKNVSEIRHEYLNSNNYDDGINYIIKNYYNKFKNVYSKSDVNEFIKMSNYYKSLKPNGILFYKHDKIIGFILTNKFDEHPNLKKKTVHIGYWGYSKEEVTKVESKFIKNKWYEYLINECRNYTQYVDAHFGAYNKSVLRLANQLGFKTKFLRLDRKVP